MNDFFLSIFFHIICVSGVSDQRLSVHNDRFANDSPMIYQRFANMFLCLAIVVERWDLAFFNRPRRAAATWGGYSVATVYGLLRQVCETNCDRFKL